MISMRIGFGRMFSGGGGLGRGTGDWTGLGLFEWNGKCVNWMGWDRFGRIWDEIYGLLFFCGTKREIPVGRYFFLGTDGWMDGLKVFSHHHRYTSFRYLI